VSSPPARAVSLPTSAGPAVPTKETTPPGLASYRRLRALFIKRQREATLDYVDGLTKHLKWADAMLASSIVPPGALHSELQHFRDALFRFLHADSDLFFVYDVAMRVFVPQPLKFRPCARKFDRWRDAIVHDFADNGVATSPPARNL